MSDLLAAALAYAEASLPVLPLRGKVPRNNNGLTGASTDAEVVREWWTRWPDANIGIRTGAESGLLVLDVDVQHGGSGTLKELEARHGKLPETAQVLTGGGGRHYLFSHPGREVRNSAGKLGHGLDVRGDGGYIVAPPSVHESGRAYKWLRALERGRSDPPAWLLDEFDEQRRNGSPAKLGELIPEGMRREAMLSVAGKLKRAGLTGNEILPTLQELNKRCRPPLEERELESVAFKSTIQPVDAIKTISEAAPRELAEVVQTFRRWLHLPDPGALYVALATIVANRLPGDPLWLLLVGASSSGKTEVLISLAGLEEVEPAATLTEASLLSGVPRKDVAAGASGGLLKKIGEYGILTLKDFGSVLSMHRDARAAVLAALRECYDGSWDRPIGADGGKVLHWQGKLGLIAGVTTVVDRHHAVIDSLGSRFAFYRIDIAERKQQAGRALEHRRRGQGMREELRDAVAGFFAGLELPEDEATLSDVDKARLVDLADFVTVARSPVERDAYASREIELIPDAEAPARFVIMLASLLEGLLLIGIGEPAAWELVTKVAFDSMPAQRRRIIEHLSAHEQTTTKEAATALGLPTTTARRTLEDLAAHGLIQREQGDKQGAPDVWRLAHELAVPEMSDTSIRHPTPLTTTFRERA
jgi:Bifunctional DNA primase/polymerase, N-terminal/MarR family